MMKKFFSILFLVVYLIATTGFAINLQYCGDELQNIVVTESEENQCCSSNVSKLPVCCVESPDSSADCCVEKELFFRLKVDATPASEITYLPVDKNFNSGIVLINDNQERKVSHSKQTSSVGFLPPPLLPLPIKHCSLIYYG